MINRNENLEIEKYKLPIASGKNKDAGIAWYHQEKMPIELNSCLSAMMNNQINDFNCYKHHIPSFNG